MQKLQKDNWDKFEIISKFLGAVVLVAIPIVIKYGADSISQSMHRAELIQSLTTQLVEGEAKRDIALIALNTAIPEKEKCHILWKWGCENDLTPETLGEDQVLGIAMTLTKQRIKDAKTQDQSSNPEDLEEDLEVAKKIIIHRTSEQYYDKEFKLDLDNLKNQRAITEVNLQVTPEQKAKIANIGGVIAAIQPPSATPTDSSLKGIRIVYIQYKSDRAKAEALQKALQKEGVSAPGIEQIKEIEKNDIRYANSADKNLAEQLRKFVETKQEIKVNSSDLIDLSKWDYQVPSGQLEIWLKD